MLSNSLDDVVKAMMFEPTEERPDSTLGWDVVVNYAADEINKLLENSYKIGKDQLKVVNLEMEKEDPRTGEMYTLKVRLDLAAPLIQFVTNGVDSSTCSLKLPIIGGLIDPGVNPTIIPDSRYDLVISRIDLATVDGTSRASQPGSNKRFTFLSTGVTSLVTLNIGSSPSITVDIVLLKGATEVKAVKAFRSDIEEGVEDILRDPGRDPIHWDLASVNSKVSGADGSPLLLPKSFRIAVCVPEGAPTVLSLFIHTHGEKHGDDSDKLQSRWDGQWATWKVSPIADPHTASIIFNNRLILNLATEWAKTQGMTLQKVVKGPTDTWQGFKFKVLLGKKFFIPFHASGSFLYYGSIDEVDLDKDLNVLTVILGQGGKVNQHVEALLEWKFESKLHFKFSMLSGKATLLAKLKEGLRKYADDKMLPNYVLRLNASLNIDDWDINVTSPGYDDIALTLKEVTPREVLRVLPWFRLELINFNFFLLHNLLLPGEKVIDFEATPGARLPLDTYIVGKVAHKSEVMARQAAYGVSSGA